MMASFRIIALCAALLTCSVASVSAPMAIIGGPGKLYGAPPGGGGEDEDWIARSTASGVVVADRLETQATIDDWLVNDALADHVSLDTSIKVANAAGSLKFAVLDADGASSGSISVPFGTTFGEGSTVWYSYRYRAERHHAYQPWPTSGGVVGAKMSILSRDANGTSPTGSNQINEVVVNNHEYGAYVGYHQNGSTFVGWEVPASTACSGSDFRFQNLIDNGANPLSGNDPDTGSAWSSCQQDRARYGPLYSASSLAQFRYGLGDPLSKGVRPTLDDFDTITGRVEIVDFGGAGNRITLWVAKPGQPYVLVTDLENQTLGNGPVYNGLTLLPYATNRIAGGSRVTSRETAVTGVEILNVGNGTATGAGQLEYNATTQLLRWRGAGETFGTARGFSAANDILDLNVASSSPADSFVVVRVTPASLPTSGTITDSVTISSGRADTQTNYNDLIISTEAINAPGGYAPVLPGASYMAEIAADMGSGEFAQMTSMTNWGGGSILSPTGCSIDNSITQYANKAVWNPVAKRFQFSGSPHQPCTSTNERAVYYDDETNTWGTLPIPGSPGNDPRHSYDHNTVDPETGEHYYTHYNSLGLWRLNSSGTTWTTLASRTGSTQCCRAQAWFPELSGGRLIHGDGDWGGRAYNPDTDTWTQLWMGNGSDGSGLPQFTGDGYSTFAHHSTRCACVIFGGGSGFYKLNSDGSFTTLSTTGAPPSGFRHVGPSGMSIVADPVSGIFVVISDGDYYEFDPGTTNASTGTWSQPAVSIPAFFDDNSGDTSESLISAPISDYDVIMYVKHNDSDEAQVWLYKR